MMKHDDTHDDGTPIFDGRNFGSALEFAHHAQLGTLPVPCWIRCGRTSMKVTEDAVKHLARGILLADLMQTEKDEWKRKRNRDE